MNEAKACDLEMLGEKVREAVLAHSGIQLHWEIKRLGARLRSVLNLNLSSD